MITNENNNPIHVSVESMEGLQRRMHVTVTETVITDDVASRLNQLTKTAKINGFRKGKVPLSVIKRQYNDAVYADVVNNTVRKTLTEAIQQQALQPAGYPTIESIDAKQGQALNYSVLFDVYPEVELHDFATLSITQLTAEITDADVDNMIEQLRQQHATWQTKDGSAEEADQVTIDFVGSIEGALFEGGSAKQHKLVLGSQSFIPGFESQLIGVSAGDEKMVDVTFPEEYQAKDLAGKAVSFAVTVHSVAIQQLPAIDDADFLANFSVKDTDELKQHIKKGMQRELTHRLRKQFKETVFEQLLAVHDFAIPTGLIEQDIDRRIDDFNQQFKQYAQTANLPDMDRELFREESTKQVKLGLILSKLIEQFEVDVDQAQIRDYITTQAESFDEPQAMIDSYMNNADRLAQLKPVVLEETLVDLVLGKAKIEQKTVSYNDIVNPKEGST